MYVCILALGYSACKLDLFCAILYYHLQPVRLNCNFPNYIANSMIFRETFLLFHYTFETFLIHRRISQDIFINVYGPSCEVPVILVEF